MYTGNEDKETLAEYLNRNPHVTMATFNNQDLTTEQLSVIADYEKSGPENVQEHYDMLLEAGW